MQTENRIQQNTAAHYVQLTDGRAGGTQLEIKWLLRKKIRNNA